MTNMEDHQNCNRRKDRWLRHIEDLEATLTRRNERHEQDQERIRELEAERARLEAEVFRDYTARECLQLAWEAAIAPEDGMIREGEEYMLQGVSGRVEGPLLASTDRRAVTPIGPERRLLQPRPEPTVEERRQAIIDEHELVDWEIELLLSHDRD